MRNLNADKIVEKMESKGIDMNTLNTLFYSGINVKDWMHGFDCVEESVERSVSVVRNHPLVPKDVAVHGLIMDPLTGEINLVINGFDSIEK